MAYEKTNWTSTTPINTTNLNKIENAIEELSSVNIITNGEPVKAGYKVDGKDVWIKRISINSLPNASNEEIDVGIPLTDEILKIEGNYGGLPLNFHYPPAIELSIGTYIREDKAISATNWVILISTGSNRSSLKGKVDIHYIPNN